ncbi:hypothetical protein NAT51_17435 [Flavobacterium amniphilum]|uniref:hypothetical protein n=1 Tax=Flavobacterium amniphilum TaxID=1834035 RepID=UPI002029F1B2|nr:hypothetical protein [Flavobacterium amniphilum]MCL9807318.1 hypothetical protein [Flavobacterium amniphilum]
MKGRLFLLAFLFVSLQSIAQEWKEIGKTGIYFSDYSSKKDIDKSNLRFECFKKDDALIAVSSFDSEYFLKLFKKSPKAFTDLFEVCDDWVTTRKEIETNETMESYINSSLDPVLINVTFDRVIAFNYRTVIRGYRELIWRMHIGEDSLGGCYVNIVFKIGKGYLATIKDTCII